MSEQLEIFIDADVITLDRAEMERIVWKATREYNRKKPSPIAVFAATDSRFARGENF